MAWLRRSTLFSYGRTSSTSSSLPPVRSCEFNTFTVPHKLILDTDLTTVHFMVVARIPNATLTDCPGLVSSNLKAAVHDGRRAGFQMAQSKHRFTWWHRFVGQFTLAPRMISSPNLPGHAARDPTPTSNKTSLPVCPASAAVRQLQLFRPLFSSCYCLYFCSLILSGYPLRLILVCSPARFCLVPRALLSIYR